MDLQDLLARLAVALGIGLLIGLERGWRMREEASGSRTAGIRTFAISGMLGGILGALAIASGGAASAGGGIIIGAGFAAYAAVMAMFAREENCADKTFSATTTVAAMTTFALGAYSLVGDMRAAAATAVGVAIILALRESLHGWIANITWPELRSALVLLAMTAIALPIVPDAAIGPYGNVNPREIWVIAIVLAGISFAGYVAVRFWKHARDITGGRCGRACVLDRCHHNQRTAGIRTPGIPRGFRRPALRSRAGSCFCACWRSPRH